MATYGYVRASTDIQDETLAVQEQQIRAQALILGREIDGIFIERGVSGSIPFAERPEGGELLTLVKPGDLIISPKLDRCFRSSNDALNVLGRLKKGGVGLHLMDLGGDVTGNGIAKLVFTILSAVAEAERDRIRERITDVKRAQKARGHFIGGSVPFGYRLEGVTLVEDQDQQAAIALAKGMKAEGHSLRSIAQTLKATGHSITHETVGKVLARVGA
jgi:DNA invertase Pin-like site-specific DNA recombinase